MAWVYGIVIELFLFLWNRRRQLALQAEGRWLPLPMPDPLADSGDKAFWEQPYVQFFRTVQDGHPSEAKRLDSLVANQLAEIGTDLTSRPEFSGAVPTTSTGAQGVILQSAHSIKDANSDGQI